MRAVSLVSKVKGGFNGNLGNPPGSATAIATQCVNSGKTQNSEVLMLLNSTHMKLCSWKRTILPLNSMPIVAVCVILCILASLVPRPVTAQ